MTSQKLILGASIGNCVHVAGIYRFLGLAEEYDYKSIFLGPAVPIEKLVQEIVHHKPQKVIVGYRLSEQAARSLFAELRDALEEKGLRDKLELILSCTPSLKSIAKEVGIFDFIFTGEETFQEILESISDRPRATPEERYPQSLPERIASKKPFPILRHHFGLPTVEETVQGVSKIAEAKVIDVISLGPDQNAQEFFFRPEQMIPERSGAGGVPLRTREDLERIYKASRRGNYPLLRCYSGTNDLVKWAHLLKETINIAWGAVPLTWYSVLDGRSKRSLEEAIRENQEAMKTYAALGVPLEVNESHQWSLRDAPDSVAVASFYLAAYNAKKAGARFYVAQYMLNTPPGIYPAADLAKMLAKKELIAELIDDNFTVFTQVRGGLAHFSADLDLAKGQLGASTALGLFLEPDIIHVVGFCEAVHLARPEEVIESAQIVNGVLKDLLFGLPSIKADIFIEGRKKELKEEANLILEAVRKLGEKEKDPFTSPRVIAEAVRKGILDAPHLLGNPEALGKTQTRLVKGVLRCVDEKGKVITEKERLRSLGF